MTPHVVEELSDLLLGDPEGGLDAPARAALEAHLATCVECSNVYAEHIEVGALLVASSDPAAWSDPAASSERPRAPLRARVLASCANGRLARFAEPVAALFQLDPARARLYLDELDDPKGWEPALLPGSFHRFVGVEDNVLKFFIRVPAGNAVPLHAHHGRENTLVLQGRLVDNAGSVWRPGEAMPQETGTQHSFRADGRVDLVCGVVSENGVTLVF